MKTERALSSSQKDSSEFSLQLISSKQIWFFFSDLQDELNRLVGDNNSSHILAVATLNRGKTNSVALENVEQSYSCRHVIL